MSSLILEREPRPQPASPRFGMPAAERHRTAVEEQFDRDSVGYFDRYSTPENLSQQRRMLSLLASRPRYQRILDIGCGPGTMSENLLQIGDQVSGVDISAGMISAATERFRGRYGRRLRFKVADAENLPFDSETFDAVVCAGVLRYLPSFDRALAEIHRVLKPGGVVVVSFYYRFSPHWFAMCLLYRPLLPLISLVKKRSLEECLGKYHAEPLPFSYRSFSRTFASAGFGDFALRHAGFDLFPINRLLPTISRRCYLTVEPALADSNILGWLGSICIVKGTRTR